MPTTYSAFLPDDHDEEAQPSPSTAAAGEPRTIIPLRITLLILHACEIFMKKDPSTSSYHPISTNNQISGNSEEGEEYHEAQLPPSTMDEIPMASSSSPFLHSGHQMWCNSDEAEDHEVQLSPSTDEFFSASSSPSPFLYSGHAHGGHQHSGPEGTARSLLPPSEVSIRCDENDNGRITRDHLPQANNSRGVREKDFRDSPGSDLEKGIQGAEQDHRSSSILVFQTQPGRVTFFWCIVRACSSWMNVLLVVYMGLSFFYWIKNIGLETGWYEGVIIFGVIIILVVVHAIRDYMHVTKQLGDTAAGVITERGNANKKLSAAQLWKLYSVMDGLGLCISILLILVMIVRLLITKEDGHPGLPTFKGKSSSYQDVVDVLNNIDRQATGTTRVLTTTYTMMLVGILEGIPFVISVSLVYWNKKTLLGKGIPQGLLSCVNMASATTICIHRIGGLRLCQVPGERFRINEKNINIEDSVTDQDVTDARTNQQIQYESGPAAKSIVNKCLFYYDNERRINRMTLRDRFHFEGFMEENQRKHLQTIAFAHGKLNDPSELILIGLLALKETDWTGIRESAEEFRNGGGKIIIFSQDNTRVLEAIAGFCGFLGPGSLVLDGNVLRSYRKEQIMERVDQIAIVGNCLLPSDRDLLVECLQQKGKTVAITEAVQQSHTGVRIEDGTKRAQGTYDLVLSEDNFSFLVSIIRHGRSINENIQKYVQYELTMVSSGFLVSLISTVINGNDPVTKIQLQLGTLMALFPGGFALLMEPPATTLAGKQPAGKLISMVMWRNIIIQVTYQVSILVTISQFEGKPVLGIGPRVNKSLVFNSYILCQVFNLFNCRRPGKKSIFEGINKKPSSWVAAVPITVGLQAAIIVIEPHVGGSPKLTGGQWMACLLIGMVSWVVDYVGKLASDLIASPFHASSSSAG